MQDEKIMVLKMVEDGKISPDEAVKLLQALATPNESNSVDVDEKLNTFYQSVESFAKDCNEKVSAIAKDVEPKLKEATKIIVEKITPLLDSLSNSLKESIKAEEKESVEPYEETDCCREDRSEDNEPKSND